MATLIYYLTRAVCAVIVITIHGFLTALTSQLQGDRTPVAEGMTTLNPVKHFEPIGFLMFLFFGFGWGQPVKTSSYNYKNRKAGSVITALLPIVIGVLYGSIIMAVSRFIPAANVAAFMWTVGYFAVSFAVYNLIPVYPLNGHKLLLALLSPNSAMKYNEMEKILQFILIILIIMGVLGSVQSAIMGFITAFL